MSTLKDELILYIETNQDLKRIFYNSLEASKELDDAIIISEYLKITDSFYANNEASLVNGILDNIQK